MIYKIINKYTGAILASVLFFIIPYAACSQKAAEEKLFEGQIAPLLEGVDGHHFTITTDNILAQRFFNQGLILSYGFNHKEAERSFRQVAELDPDNPMAWWGVALVLGPNINAGMSPDAVPVAWSALQKAQELKEHASPREQAYIEALSKRYAEHPPEDRASLDLAYAEAMGKLAAAWPNDLDAQVLYAEALMDLHPWDYWKRNGEPQPWTPEILEILEWVIEQDSDHPGANHFYIHAVEASKTPERSLPSANRLHKLVPGAGHLVHMPAHIYIRTGNYHEGTLANQRAIKSDNEYITQCRQQGIYPLAYMPHNHHFMWATATLEGRRELSIKAAYSTSSMVDTAMMRMPGMGTLQHFRFIPLYAHVRFGGWNEILAYPEPAGDLLYPHGVWRYARGIAFMAKGEYTEAKIELDKLKKIAAEDTLRQVTIWEINTTKELMKIAVRVLEGELAAKGGDYSKAVRLLQEAVAIEDQLNYNEPPDWFFPVRHNLGAVLLQAGRPDEAEEVYRKDLEKFPENGWSLYGLTQSLLAQGETEAASKVKRRFEKAWKYADVTLTASRYN